MKHRCLTCKFNNTPPLYVPCKTCSVIWSDDGFTDNWQPAKPRRKELQAQLDVANEEMKSMHNELQAKQAIIETLKGELAEGEAELLAARGNVAELASREAAMRRELRSHGIDPHTVLREDVVYLEAKAKRKAAK